MPSATPTIICVDEHHSQSHGGVNEGTLNVLVKVKDTFIPFTSPQQAFEANYTKVSKVQLEFGHATIIKLHNLLV
jgi:hypothetical protein